ncbi:MAG: hypothetical protein IT390_14555 [Nitrospira sp.]|nr:hypothetical protein [Nitrospira sp.]
MLPCAPSRITFGGTPHDHTYTGSCHCGAIAFEVQGEIDSALSFPAAGELKCRVAKRERFGHLGENLHMAKRRNTEGTRFLRYFGPLLDALRKLGGSGSPDEVVEQIAADMELSDDEQNELVPSGGSRLKTNVAWARFYLVREGLVDSSRRGVWSLTEKG